MLVDLTKEELKLLDKFISYYNDWDELSTEEYWYDDMNKIKTKLKNISNACTCKEDSNVK